MSLHDYIESKRLGEQNWGFHALIMAALRQADTINHAKLAAMFPDVAGELQARYDRPFGGVLRDEPPALVKATHDERCGVCGREISGEDPIAEIVGRLPNLRDVTICLDCCGVHFDLPAEDGPLAWPA